MTRRRGYIPLYIKFILPILLILVVGSGIVTWSLIRRDEKRITASLQERGLTIAEYLSFNSEFGVLTRNEELLSGQLDKVLKVKDVVRAEISDSEGKILAAKSAPGLEEQAARDTLTVAVPMFTVRVERRKEEIGLLSPSEEHPSPETATGGGEEPFLEPDEEPDEPEEARTELIGRVNIVMSKREVNASMARTRNTILVVTALTLALLSGMVAVLMRFVTRPLKQLVMTTQRIAAGNLSEKMTTAGNDEIGELAVSFNRMVAQLKGSIENLHRTSDFSQAMIPPKETESLMEVIGERFEGMGAVRRAVIYLYDPKGGVFVRAMARGGDAGAPPRMADEGLAELCRASEEVDCTAAVGPWTSAMLDTGIRCLLPLRSKESLVGLVALEPADPGVNFSGEERDLLRTFAYIAAMAIENLKLLEVRTENEILRIELKFAHEIQMRLLPQGVPDVSGFNIHPLCLPARDLGGDYYDIIRLGESDGRFGMTVADVAGKGVPAALYMASSRSLLRAEAGRHPRPGEVLSSMNRLLYADMKDKTFVSMFYGVFDPASRSLEFANAGHVSPILLRRREEEHLYLQSPGLPLGITDSATYEDRKVNLGPEDIIILYTDGLIEAMNSRRELFGFERLEKTLQQARAGEPKDIVERIMSEVSDFVGPEPLSDDLTLIAVQVV